MKKRILIVCLILCGFLAASMNFAVAVYSETFPDDIGDVVDFDTGENVTGKDNLDIKELACNRDYRKVTLKLTVEGVIENKGDILVWRLLFDTDFFDEYTAGMTQAEKDELLLSMLQQDMVLYIFDLSTSDDIYQIIYTNNGVIILDGETNIIEEDTKSAIGNTLTISFNLPSSKENLTDIIVSASEFSNLGETSHMDDLSVECNDEGPTGGNNNSGDSNQDDSDFESGLTIFIALIAIIVIIGVIVAVIIIRR